MGEGGGLRPIWKKFTFWIIFFGFPKHTFLLKLINMVKYSNQSKHIFSLNSGIKKQKIHFWLFRTKTPKPPISLFFSTLSAEKFNNRNLSKFHKNIFLLAGISIQGSLTNINPPPKKKLHRVLNYSRILPNIKIHVNLNLNLFGIQKFLSKTLALLCGRKNNVGF